MSAVRSLFGGPSPHEKSPLDDEPHYEAILLPHSAHINDGSSVSIPSSLPSNVSLSSILEGIENNKSAASLTSKKTTSIDLPKDPPGPSSSTIHFNHSSFSSSSQRRKQSFKPPEQDWSKQMPEKVKQMARAYDVKGMIKSQMKGTIAPLKKLMVAIPRLSWQKMQKEAQEARDADMRPELEEYEDVLMAEESLLAEEGDSDKSIVPSSLMDNDGVESVEDMMQRTTGNLPMPSLIEQEKLWMNDSDLPVQAEEIAIEEESFEEFWERRLKKIRQRFCYAEEKKKNKRLRKTPEKIKLLEKQLMMATEQRKADGDLNYKMRTPIEITRMRLNDAMGKSFELSPLSDADIILLKEALIILLEDTRRGLSEVARDKGITRSRLSLYMMKLRVHLGLPSSRSSYRVFITDDEDSSQGNVNEELSKYASEDEQLMAVETVMRNARVDSVDRLKAAVLDVVAGRVNATQAAEEYGLHPLNVWRYTKLARKRLGEKAPLPNLKRRMGRTGERREITVRDADGNVVDKRRRRRNVDKDQSAQDEDSTEKEKEYEEICFFAESDTNCLDEIDVTGNDEDRMEEKIKKEGVVGEVVTTLPIDAD